MTGQPVFRARTLLRSAILLAMALSFAQVGALAHAYSHLQKSSGAPDRAPIHATLCGDCATFGAVLVPGGSPATGIALPIAPPAEGIEALFLTDATRGVRHHFQAQGPPTLR